MEFQILSHAGLRVSNGSREFLCDPWLVGSSYWRSWWNYPPVSRELIDSLRPDFIYLTHIHWDHFHGPSLRRFPKSIRILVPKGNYTRIKRDLVRMGYKDVHEMKHGETYKIDDNFRITSYQFGLFLDSALVIECGGVTLLNANDAKFMGSPLDQILHAHPSIDFVFRSHSSANSRLCYEIIDAPDHPVDDIERYIKNFSQFTQRSRAKYAVPFASNHCFLHKDVYSYNDTVQTPGMVKDYFRKNNITTPEVKIMLSGDSWSSEHGFQIAATDYFSARESHLLEYANNMKGSLESTYHKEDSVKVSLAEMSAYFDKFSRAVPYLVRRQFRGHPILYVLKSGEQTRMYEVDIASGRVTAVERIDDVKNPIQIHTAAAIFRHCIKLDLFSHLAISKRVKYRVTRRERKIVSLLNLLFNFYEYDMLPMRKILQWRFFETWALRWREIILYMFLVKDYLLNKKINYDNYLVPKGSKVARS
ncbi:MAG: MBL fold metallo-hydrolase [Sulfuricaulis sp.]